MSRKLTGLTSWPCLQLYASAALLWHSHNHCSSRKTCTNLLECASGHTRTHGGREIQVIPDVVLPGEDGLANLLLLIYYRAHDVGSGYTVYIHKLHWTRSVRQYYTSPGPSVPLQRGYSTARRDKYSRRALSWSDDDNIYSYTPM